MNELDLILDQCPIISDTAEYWFIRTDGGDLYENFVKSRTIGIGYPKIEAEFLNRTEDSIEGLKALRKEVHKYYPDKKVPGMGAGQLMRFAKQIKEGDFVIIPSESTARIAIGQVKTGEMYQYEDEQWPDYNKRIDVSWKRGVNKDNIHPSLLRMLSTHVTLSKANDAAKWVDELLFDFFKKGDEWHLNFNITHEDGINARALYESNVYLLNLAESYLKTLNPDEDTSDLETRINLNSPGREELSAKNGRYLLLIGLLIIAINGGQLNVEFGDFKQNLGTDGIIKNYNEFLNDKSNRDFRNALGNKFEQLEIKDPAVLTGILDKLNTYDQIRSGDQGQSSTDAE